MLTFSSSECGQLVHTVPNDQTDRVLHASPMYGPDEQKHPSKDLVELVDIPRFARVHGRHRKSSETADNAEYDSELSDDSREDGWRHMGNGFYKRANKPSIPFSRHGSRGDLGRSQVETGMLAPQEVKRYRIQDFRKFPGDEPVHCANGWYRRKSTLKNSPDRSAIESSDDGVVMKDGKFSAKEMTDHRKKFPDAQFVHRGDGRYVLWTFDKNTAKTFSKAYVKQHPDESFFHTGAGRYFRDTAVFEKPAIPIGLDSRG
jgi:hypothetical protein